ncbi:hypothetical protein DOY81_007174 [Sarcophaga bullata]|nr:hypothetical protein DOY81_007174 [Sarcophaga bullata]
MQSHIVFGIGDREDREGYAGEKDLNYHGEICIKFVLLLNDFLKFN